MDLTNDFKLIYSTQFAKKIIIVTHRWIKDINWENEFAVQKYKSTLVKN